MGMGLGGIGKLGRLGRPAPSKGGGVGGATAPAQFGAGEWSVANVETVDVALLTITTLPSNGGSEITDLEYQVDGGSWVSLGDVVTGPYSITGLTYNTAQTIAIRAVNAVGNGDASATKSVTPTGLAETDALIARFTTPPTTARAKLINTLIGSLIIAGVWAKADGLHVYAAHDAQAARRNWIADAYNATAVSSPTFAQDRGYTGNGSSSYLDTNFNPSTAGGKYQQNSACLGGWNLTIRAASAARPLVGAESAASSGSNIYVRLTGNLTFYRCNDNTEAAGLSDTVSNGLFASNRSTSSGRQAYKNGASAGSIPSNTSRALVNANLRALNDTIKFSADQIACMFWGESLTAGEHEDLYTALSAYLTAVGALE